VSVARCQPIGLMQLVGRKGSVVVQLWRETLRDRRNSNKCDSEIHRLCYGFLTPEEGTDRLS